MIDQYPPANGVLTSLIWRKTAAGGETSLSGYDNASQALSYTPGQEQVYLNGILLVRGSDYTATNGTSITGLTALAVDDFVQINCYNNFSVASVPAASLTGTVANNQLANSSITINGSAVSLGGSVSLAGDIESVTATSPLTGGGTTGALTVGIQSASTSQSGAVQLSDSTSTTSSVLAATPTAVKSAYDLANGAIPNTLTTTTGDIIYASAANTPARLGIGSSAQVLTVAAGVPSWTTPSSGGMTLISTTTLAGNTTISSIPSTYVNLEVHVFRTKNTANDYNLICLPNNQNLSTDEFSNRASTGTMTFRQDDYIRFTGNASTAMANDQTNAWVWHIYNYASSTAAKPFTISGGYYNNGKFVLMTTGLMRDTSAITSLVFQGAGSSNSGTVLVYGVK
jgi:hypothetical protein